MVRSTAVLESIQQALSKEDWKLLENGILDLYSSKRPHARKSLVNDICRYIIDYSLKTGRPSLLVGLPDIKGSEIDDLFSRIVQQYIHTKDEGWLTSLYSLSDKLGKKSFQSRVYAMIAKDLIDAGVSGSNPDLIKQGLLILDRISFRKYRSEIMIEIIPRLIVWSVTTRDQQLLYTSLRLIEYINDISKRAVLHAEIVKALATIAILEKDKPKFIRSIILATQIHQKVRRQTCILFIIENGARSSIGREMQDIVLFLENFTNLSPELVLEIDSALTNQLLERSKDKNQVMITLTTLCRHSPRVTRSVILDLLNKAERSGDAWYLSTAMQFQQLIDYEDVYPVREIVRAGISIARRTRDMQVLKDLIPVINTSCNPSLMSRIFLQFSQIMLSSGDFESAVEISTRIRPDTEHLSQYIDNLTLLLKEGIVRDSIGKIEQNILRQLQTEITTTAIYRAVLDTGRDFPFDVLITQRQAFSDLVLLHPKKDHLLFESVTSLVERGFLNSHDPGILIQLAGSISDQSIHERAISSIVIKIAKIGVQSKSRDYLQRAVGLTCEINGQSTRSATLSSIIDEASNLAAQQGDLDLLLRMKVWSSSLLEKDLAAYANANIIDGVIKYAINKQSPDALEDAYRIALEIEDLSLQSQLCERIAECYVKIGSILLAKPDTETGSNHFDETFHPFIKALSIIKNNINNPQISLKIAGVIDILISYARNSSNPDFIIPLAMYSSEIENLYERDAMMSRIISNLNENITYPDSTDPYEIMVFLLLRTEYAASVSSIIDLTYHMLQRVNDPLIRLTGICNLADSSVKTHDPRRAKEILSMVYTLIPRLPAEYQKVLVLGTMASVFCRLDAEAAPQYLKEAIALLDSVEYDKISQVRKQMVLIIVSVNMVVPHPRWFTCALDVSSKIADPKEYIISLIAIFGMIITERSSRAQELINRMIDAAERIPSAYEKASVLLDIIPLSLQNLEEDVPVKMLKKADALTNMINIQYVADTLRDEIAQIYLTLFDTYGERKYLIAAIEISRSIQSDELRTTRLDQIGAGEHINVPTQYTKIRSLSAKIITEGYQPAQIASLERLVRSVADRGKEAVFFCDLAIYFKNKAEEKISKRMIQSAVREARIIRPLSRRAYVMCDIAIKTYAAECYSASQMFLDYAIDAATNIRQPVLRDEVFDELERAIKLMQEMNIESH